MHRIPFIIFLLLGGLASEGGATLSSDEAGRAAYSRGDYQSAIDHFTDAMQQDKSDASLFANRGNSFAHLGKMEQALSDLTVAFEMRLAECGDATDKRFAYLYFCRGFAYYKGGRPDQALIDFDKAIELDPGFPQVHGYVAWILATSRDPSLRDPKKAIEYALKEAAISAEVDAAILDSVAAAYAADGQFDSAKRQQELAVMFADNEEQRRRYMDRLHLYGANKPYVESPANRNPYAEQSVAPQSATRSESDSAGGHKPQPESETRSR